MTHKAVKAARDQAMPRGFYPIGRNERNFKKLERDFLASRDTSGPGVKNYGIPRSKYLPHQGKQEIARRLAAG